MPLLLIFTKFKFNFFFRLKLYYVPSCSIKHNNYVSFVLCMLYHIWHFDWIWLYMFFLLFFWFSGGDGNRSQWARKWKASILCEASKLLKDLLCQIQSLKKKNLSLLSESHYVRLTLFLLLWSHHFTFFFCTINLLCWVSCMLNFDAFGEKMLFSFDVFFSQI
jgi:hypothetical protein